jgi:hypothetical protein
MKLQTIQTMRTITKPTSIILFLLFILSACSKERIVQTPPPGNGGESTPPVEKAMVRFVTNADLTGQPYHTSNLRAVVTIVNDKGQEVAKDKLLSLTLPNPVQTEAIELPIGSYKLTSFRMEYGSVNTHFATPITGSAKASLVQHPLAMDFKVENCCRSTSRSAGRKATAIWLSFRCIRLWTGRCQSLHESETKSYYENRKYSVR